ncbi:dipeptide ABC superfamily ATP binding cassette transporter, membrane protein [Neisseria wadsworthii 9715]|uniref:Dipeptide ABC superfamily ATP binding cassette transporter, membrane protein n=1 Tax=Neisseria wadsworthii 9715 TaxID=1030841 RepID=G4CMB3_9NEIS|nr:dipeptide ABC superfamily ATP binding cassette transporter, membrane protein [Neisseria wadsworthii 9715]
MLFTFCHIELWANPYRLSENTTTIKISSLPNFISPYKIQYLNLKSSNNYAKFLFLFTVNYFNL